MKHTKMSFKAGTADIFNMNFFQVQEQFWLNGHWWHNSKIRTQFYHVRRGRLIKP